MIFDKEGSGPPVVLIHGLGRTSSSAISLTYSPSIQVWSYVPVVVAASVGVVVGAVVLLARATPLGYPPS
jgi:hypothetical protein